MIDHMELHEIIRQRRSELGMSQSDLAAKVGVDKRQIRRYESGETQPTLPIAKAIARALGISIDELAGEQTHRVNLTGHWWASWQTSRPESRRPPARKLRSSRKPTPCTSRP